VQIISLAGWVNIMYYVQDAHSFWDWIYFTALIVVSWVMHRLELRSTPLASVAGVTINSLPRKMSAAGDVITAVNSLPSY